MMVAFVWCFILWRYAKHRQREQAGQRGRKARRPSLWLN
jgi:hypothetical protein